MDMSGKIIATYENLFISEGKTVIPLKEIYSGSLPVGAYIFTVTVSGRNYSVNLVKAD